MPAAGRNAGAKAAKGEFLYFFDADVIMPEHFLRETYRTMQTNFHDLATTHFEPISKLKLDKLLFELANSAVRLSLRIDPRAPGFSIIVTKRLFDRVGGFDETINVGEDSDFVKRASKFRSLYYLPHVSLKVSVRRLEKEGRFTYFAKTLKVDLHRIFRGELKGHEIDYEFGNFNTKQEEKNFLAKIEKIIIQLDTYMEKEKQRTQQKRKKQTKRIVGAAKKISSKLDTIFRKLFK